MSKNLGTVTNDIIDAMASHAATLGVFEYVNQYEPQTPPGTGLTAAIWNDRILPAPRISGLAATAVLLVQNVRIYASMLQEPQDRIDPAMMGAVGDLLGAYSGDFTFGGFVSWVDLLGQGGYALSSVAGYLEQDAKVYRVQTITVPCVVDDVWDQEP